MDAQHSDKVIEDRDSGFQLHYMNVQRASMRPQELDISKMFFFHWLRHVVEFAMIFGANNGLQYGKRLASMIWLDIH